MKGFQRTRTKAQDLREISFKQDGFLTGLNLDSPKSDVGDTQVTVLKNAIPYRDRIEARGGLKTLTGYKKEGQVTDEGIEDLNNKKFFYDNDFDEFFLWNDTSISVDGELTNLGKLDRGSENCFDYLLSVLDITFIPDDYVTHERLKDGVFFSTSVFGGGFRNSYIEYTSSQQKFFLRPFNSDAGSNSSSSNITSTGVGTNGGYSFLYSFVRKINDVVLSESNIITKEFFGVTGELSSTYQPFELFDNNIGPDEYYDTSRTGTKNYYTHIRYYRTTYSESQVDGIFSEQAYFVYDYPLNNVGTLPTPPSSLLVAELNVTDSEMTSDSSRPVVWQSGYQAIGFTTISTSSSGFFLCRNNNKKNEYIYCPTGSGDNQKYLGWYNPLFQYGSVDGDITQMKDMGSYVVITTENKTYYVDTVNYIEDEGQRSAGIFTPILPESVLISDDVGVSIRQSSAFVKDSTGKAIALTSNGEIRRFEGYQWGPDLSFNKVHSITKGEIYRDDIYCQAAFVNDAYYLGYNYGIGLETKTLRMGTTEESGFGFSEFEGNGWTPNLNQGEQSTATTGFQISNVFYFLNLRGTLCVINQNGVGGVLTVSEYTGDKFDKKLNKDVTDFSGVTTYHDIVSQIEFPEFTGSSEYYFLYFLKSHFYLRADRFCYKVTDEGTTAGYEITDNNIESVSLSDVTFGMDARIGESEDIIVSNEGFQPDSGVTLAREVQDNRVRITMRGDASGFQLTGMESHFKRHDRTKLEETTREDNIEALVTNVYCIVDDEFINKCVGQSRSSRFDIGAPIEGALIGSSPDPIVTGGSVSFVDGPNSDTSKKAVLIPTGVTAEFQLPESQGITSGTIMYWGKLSSPNTGKINFGYSFGGSFTPFDFPARDTADWSHVAYVFKTTGEYDLYIDGVFDSTVSTPIDNADSMSLLITGDIYVYDLRAYRTELTLEQINLYIDNILNNHGDYLDGY